MASRDDSTEGIGPSSPMHQFTQCLREIEKLYVGLPKVQRLRVEHWVRKLSLTGGNESWCRSRDQFAKMLLNMVIRKHLEEPFDKLPPEGPLPPFPAHLRCRLKDMVGPHETSFWREVYDNVKHTGIMQQQHQALHSPPQKNRQRLDQLESSTLTRRELDNMIFLNQELERKVLLLEQQLHEERLRHEMEIQKLLALHREELVRLKDVSSNLKAMYPNRTFNRRASVPANPTGIEFTPAVPPGSDTLRKVASSSSAPLSAAAIPSTLGTVFRAHGGSSRLPPSVPSAAGMQSRHSPPETDRPRSSSVDETSSNALLHHNQTPSDASTSALVGKRLNMSQFMSVTRAPPNNADLVPMQSSEPMQFVSVDEYNHQSMNQSIYQEQQHSNKSIYTSLRDRSGTQDSIPPPPQYEDAPPVQGSSNPQGSGDIYGRGPSPHEYEARTASSRSESPDSVLSSTIPTNEQDFMNYLTQFQEEIRRLQYKP